MPVAKRKLPEVLQEDFISDEELSTTEDEESGDQRDKEENEEKGGGDKRDDRGGERGDYREGSRAGLLPLIKTSPQTDLNNALRNKNESQQERFLLLVQDNVRLNRENSELNKNKELLTEQLKHLEQKNQALLSNNEVMTQQVKDVRSEMGIVIEAAMKSKEKSDAQLAISFEDKVHLDIWPNESPEGKLWYDNKFQDLHNKIKLLSNDALERNKDFIDAKKYLENQILLTQKYKEKLTAVQLKSIEEEMGDIGIYEHGTRTQDNQSQGTRSTICMIM